jgi:predicted enzyme related to lactoylglutathione lyase
MAAHAAYVVLDSVDPDRLAPFWCGLLGVGVSARLAEGQYVVLESCREGEPPLSFQRVPEAKSVKNRMHLDLEVDDLEASTSWVTEHGGRCVDGTDHELEGYRWRCMADPEGNEFDIIPSG